MEREQQTGSILEPSAEPRRQIVGLLAYEKALLETLLIKFQIERVETADQIKLAVDNSGGDWALDDDSVKAAVEHAHILDVRMAELPEILKVEGDELLENPEGEAVGFGSRVMIDFGGGDTESFDLVTRILPELPEAPDVTRITLESPLGQAVIGTVPGSTISWGGQGAGDTRVISADVVAVDQTAQITYYQQVAAELQAEIQQKFE